MRVGKLPSNWCISTLAEIARPIGGSTPSKSDPSLWENGTVPWVSPKDMKVFDLHCCEDAVSEIALKRLALIPPDSILVVVRSGILSRILPVAINHLAVTINQDMRAFVPERGINARFIAWQLLANQRDILGKCSKDGTTVASIEALALASFPLALPPANEQHRIVAKIEELFSELDQGVASLKTAREQLKVYRQSLLKNAFAGKLTAAWRAAHADQLETAAALQQRIARERSERHRQQLADWQANDQTGPKPNPPKPLPPLTPEKFAELPELPAGWGWLRLAEIGNVETGTTPSKSKPENFGGSYPFFKPTDLDAGANVRIAREYLSEAGLSESRFLPKNSVLVTCIGATIGKVGITRVDGTSNQQINAVVPLGTNADFVYRQIAGPFFQEAIKANASSTTLPILNKSKFESLAIAICGVAEQDEIVALLESKLSEADQLDQTLATALQQAEALRQSILKKAFCGQLVKQDQSDEPASALLERIRAARAPSPAKGRQARLGSKPLPNC